MEQKEETIWEELDRFIGSIGDEIRSDDMERSSIDFWLFKIKRRVDNLHATLEPEFFSNKEKGSS